MSFSRKNINRENNFVLEIMFSPCFYYKKGGNPLRCFIILLSWRCRLEKQSYNFFFCSTLCQLPRASFSDCFCLFVLVFSLIPDLILCLSSLVCQLGQDVVCRNCYNKNTFLIPDSTNANNTAIIKPSKRMNNMILTRTKKLKKPRDGGKNSFFLRRP